jgi:hypothetical protein
MTAIAKIASEKCLGDVQTAPCCHVHLSGENIPLQLLFFYGKTVASFGW